MNGQKKHALPLVLTELAFVYLPLVVLFVYGTITYLDWPESAGGYKPPSLLVMIISEREISFAAAVLFGLSTIKCHIAARKLGDSSPWLISKASNIVVFGLVSTLTVLVVLLSDRGGRGFPTYACLAQSFLLIVSTVTFIFTGLAAESEKPGADAGTAGNASTVS
jgi:hypothetical protein